MSEQSNIKTWPERIYLQHGDFPEVPAFHEVYPGNGYSDGVTWCQDRIEGADVEYVRADLAAAPVAALAPPETWKVLPSPVHVTGELLHATYPGFNGGPWEASGNQGVWNDWAEQLNVRLSCELKQEAKEQDEHVSRLG